MNSGVSFYSNIYCFDDIIVDAGNFCVQKNGEKLNLTPRAFDVLIFLLQHTGRVVEKKEIFDSVWKDTFVNDNALTKIIKEIRHALEDSADHPRYIETIPKRGYRFIGQVGEMTDQSVPEIETTDPGPKAGEQDNSSGEPIVRRPFDKLRSHFNISKAGLGGLLLGLLLIAALAFGLRWRQKNAEITSSPIRTVAVLPFKPLNAESRDESLEMGMAETLITRLSNLKQIAVRPMSAVRKYTNLQQDPVKAGQEVQAEAVLDGSIQKAGERVRVTVRLIDVRHETTLWSEQFDENFTDIFKVQDSIAERITNALTLRLSRQERELLTKHYTDNPEAYQLYLRGQFIWHGRRQNWTEQSLASYEQALAKDPNFALAYIGAADAYIMLSGQRKISMPEAEAKARPNIIKALEIDNSLAQAHNALAELKYQYEYDWTEAEKEFKTAIELNPNVAWIRQANGWFLMSAGRFDEAAPEMEKARQLDPSSLTISVGRGRLFYYSRQYDQAISYFQNIIAVEPNDNTSYHSLSTIYEQKQMYPEAVEAYLKSESLSGTGPEKLEALREAFRTSGWKGFLRKRLANLERQAQTGDVEPFLLANLYVRLGQKDEAFKYLEKSFAAHDPIVLQFKIEPAYDSLRDDPRYAALIRQIGLEP